jgi:hypothetical protein
MEIEWSNEIGVSNLCDVCTKRKVWWIKLENGQAAQVADINVVINPFPMKGQTPVCSVRRDVFTPGLKYDCEKRRFGLAVLSAGEWLGRILADNNEK